MGCSESMLSIHKWKKSRPKAAFTFDDDNNNDGDVLFFLLNY